MSGFAMGLLGGLGGGAENIVNHNNMIDREELEKNRQIDILKAQDEIVKAREQRMLEMQQSEENRAGQLFKAAVEKNSQVLPDNQQSQQYRMLKEQGGDEMMTDEVKPARGKVDLVGLLRSAMETGNKSVVEMAKDRFNTDLAIRKDDRDDKNAVSLRKYHEDSIGIQRDQKANKAAYNQIIGEMRAGSREEARWKNAVDQIGFVRSVAGEDKKDEVANMAAARLMMKARQNGYDPETSFDRISQVVTNAQRSANAMITKNPKLEYADAFNNSLNEMLGDASKPRASDGKNNRTGNVAAPVDNPKQEQSSTEKNDDKTAVTWAKNVLPRFDVMEPSGELFSGIKSAFANTGSAVDKNNPDSIFSAINEIDQYIPRLKGADLQKALEIRKKLMSYK